MKNKSLFIITGCSSGIGLALCRELVKNEHNTVLGLARNCPFESVNFHFIKLDLSDISRVKRFELPNMDNYGRISLINNAGMLGEVNTLDKINIEHIDNVIQVNYTAAMLLATKFIQKAQSLTSLKTIINISSGAATGPYSSWANYCASKAALEMFSRCVELEQKEQLFPIRCYSIAPGVVDTQMQAQIRSTPEENFKLLPKFLELYATNKLYNPDKVALHLIDILYHPENFPESVFRIQLSE